MDNPSISICSYLSSLSIFLSLSVQDRQVDAILGNVVAIAQKHGVPVPRLETMLAALRMRA